MSDHSTAELDVFCSISFLKGLMLYHDLMEEYHRAQIKIYRKAKQRIQKERAEAAQKASGLSEQLDRLMNELSGGNNEKRTTDGKATASPAK